MVLRSRLHLFSVNRRILVLWLITSLTLCYIALTFFDGSSRIYQQTKQTGDVKKFSKDSGTMQFLLAEVKKLKDSIADLQENLKLIKSEVSTAPLQQDSNEREASKNRNLTLKENRNIQIRHGLNAHIWYGHCLKTIQNTCDLPIFPRAPDMREVVQNFDISRSSVDFSQRVFGFLQPPASGLYVFAIASDDSSELWLSTDHDSRNSALIASVGSKDKIASVDKGDFFHFPNQKSAPILLEKGKKYFIEALHVEAGGVNFLQVAWQEPTRATFESLNPRYLFTYLVKKELNPPKMYDFTVLKSVSCKNTAINGQRNPFFAAKPKPVYIDHTEVEGVLPTCSSYNPSYIVRDRKLKKYEAYNHMIFYTKVYPLPEFQAVRFPSWAIAKPGLERSEAESVVALYMKELKRNQPGYVSL